MDLREVPVTQTMHISQTSNALVHPATRAVVLVLLDTQPVIVADSLHFYGVARYLARFQWAMGQIVVLSFIVEQINEQ